MSQRSENTLTEGSGIDSMKEQPLFAFLDGWQPAAAREAEAVERMVYDDPPSALIRSRKWLEGIVDWLLKEEGVVDVYENLAERTRALKREGFITETIFDAMEMLRLEGNKAAHQNGYGTVEESLRAHRYLYQLAVWWMEVYGSADFQAPPYRHPPVDRGVDTAEIERVISQTLEEKLSSMEEWLIKRASKENAPSTTMVDDRGNLENEGELEKDGPFDLIAYLKEHGLDPIDKRGAGGSLWVIGGWELNKILFPLKKYQIYFRFSKKGGRATGRRPGWFLLVKASKNVPKSEGKSGQSAQTDRAEEKVNGESKIRDALIPEAKGESDQLIIPEHLQGWSVHRFESSPVTEFSAYTGIQTFSDITVEGLRDWYRQNRRGFYNLTSQLWFFGVHFGGELQQIVDLHHDKPLRWLHSDHPLERPVEEVLPISVQSNFKRFGIHQVSQMNHLPLDSIQWVTQEAFYETMNILSKHFSLMTEEGMVEQKTVCFEGKKLVIPPDELGMKLSHQKFPGCQSLINGMKRELGIQKVSDLPNDLSVFQAQLKGVGPGRIKKFFLLLQDVFAEKLNKDQEYGLKEGELHFGSISLVLPSNLRKQSLDVSDFPTCPGMVESLKTNGIKQYDQLPSDLMDLTYIPQVGKKSLDKFTKYLQVKVEQAKEEEEEQKIIESMGEEELLHYEFNRFARRLDEMLSHNSICDELNMSSRALEMFRKRYESDLKGKRFTLEELGQEYGLTRERIRQIVKKAVNKIAALGRKWWKGILDRLEKNEGRLSNEWVRERSFRNYLILEVLEHQGVHLAFDRWILTNCSPKDLLKMEREIVKSVDRQLEGSLWTQKEIETWMNSCAEEWNLPVDSIRHYVYPRLEQVSDQRFILKKYKKKNIVLIVMKEFKEGIEVYKEANLLVERANRLIPGLFKKGREFTSICTREQLEDLYLWGRGVYIHRMFVQEDVDFLQGLAEEMAEKLSSRQVFSIYPFYNRNQEEMNKRNIPNEYALYSLLRRHCSHIVSFPKFPKVVKLGSYVNIRNEELIKDYIRERGTAVSLDELRQEFCDNQGWKLFTLQFTLNAAKDFIQVDLGKYGLLEFYEEIEQDSLQNIADQIKEKLTDLSSIQINGLFKENKAYCLSKGIRSSYMLYNLLKLLFKNQFEFIRYPHIARKGVESESLTVVSLVEEFILAEQTVVDREEVLHWLTEEVGGRPQSFDNALIYSEEIFYYKRGRYGEYIHRDVLGWNDSKSEQLRRQVMSVLDEEEEVFGHPFVSIDKCLMPEDLPDLDIELPWTRDLLIDCIRKDGDFLLLGARGHIVTKKENRKDIRSNTGFVEYVLQSDFDGAAKMKDLSEKLIEYQYSSDGELLQEVDQQVESGQAAFQKIGDELIIRSLPRGLDYESEC